jgi:hypothetical protein
VLCIVQPKLLLSGGGGPHRARIAGWQIASGG